MLVASVALSKSSTILLPSSLPLFLSSGVVESASAVTTLVGASLGIKSPRILLCTLLVCMDLAEEETLGPFLWTGRAESILIVKYRSLNIHIHLSLKYLCSPKLMMLTR